MQYIFTVNASDSVFEDPYFGVDIEVLAWNEKEAIEKAKPLVKREYYRVIKVVAQFDSIGS